WALGIALLGFFGPGLVEGQLERAASRAHTVTLVLAVAGLGVHEFFDGVGLASSGDGSVLAIAVALHRLPIAITVWWLLSRSAGARTAAIVLVLLGCSTVSGYVLAEVVGSAVDDRLIGLLEALIGGSLLHVVVHLPAPLAAPTRGRVDRLVAG